MFLPSKTLPPFTANVKPSDYHALKGGCERGNAAYVMSRSDLVDFSKCPSKWRVGILKKSTQAMDFGSLVDCLVLDPSRFAKDYVIEPDVYQPEGSATSKPWSNNALVCQRWNEEQKVARREIVDLGTLEKARACANRIHGNHRIADILAHSQKQVMFCVEWHDDETGVVVPFVCLIDILPEFGVVSKTPDLGRSIYDLKTARDAEYSAWVKAVFSDKLYFQAGCYTLAANAVTGLKYDMFGHAIAENTPPYEPTARLITQEWLSAGVSAFEYEMRRYCKAVKTGFFEGYDNKWVEPEPWMIDKL